MTNRPSLDDYIDVAERIVEFNAKYPDGTLQTISWSVEKVDDKTFIVYRAAAYRTPADERPGQGIAWEPFPGGTPYTKNSELMNAETAAWGRAIVACGLTANRALASRQEVRARTEEQEAEGHSAASGQHKQAGKATTRGKATNGRSGAAKAPSVGVPATTPQMTQLGELYAQSGLGPEGLRVIIEESGARGSKNLTTDQAVWVIAKLQEPVDEKAKAAT